MPNRTGSRCGYPRSQLATRAWRCLKEHGAEGSGRVAPCVRTSDFGLRMTSHFAVGLLAMVSGLRARSVCNLPILPARLPNCPCYPCFPCLRMQLTPRPQAPSFDLASFLARWATCGAQLGSRFAATAARTISLAAGRSLTGSGLATSAQRLRQP